MVHFNTLHLFSAANFAALSSRLSDVIIIDITGV